MKYDYRRIYEKQVGPIPKDENGRTYEIHHIDGNHNNNDINNLKLVSIEEHYNIHYAQGDWGACTAMAVRLGLPLEILSELSRKTVTQTNNRLLEAGTHNFLGDKNPVYKLIKEGKHNWLGSKNNLDRVARGIHPFMGTKNTDKMLASGTHASQIKKTCSYCGIVCSSNTYSRWHGDKCKKNR